MIDSLTSIHAKCADRIKSFKQGVFSRAHTDLKHAQIKNRSRSKQNTLIFRCPMCCTLDFKVSEDYKTSNSNSNIDKAILGECKVVKKVKLENNSSPIRVKCSSF